MDAVTALATAAAGALDVLAAAEVRRVALPLRRAHVAAHGSEAVRDLLLLRLTATDGGEGWGECPTFATAGYTTEFTGAAWDRLRQTLIPDVLAGVHTDALRSGRVLDPSFPMASAALEGALVDLGLRRSGRALRDALGATTDRLDRCVVVSLPETAAPGARADAVIEEVAAAVAQGAVMVKLKVDPLVGIGHVAAVCTSFPDLRVAVDANGSLAGCGDLLDDLAQLDLAYIEQPLPPGHPEASSVAGAVGVPIALDESVTSPEVLAGCLEAGEGRVVNLKAARVGGLAVAMRCAAIAGVAGVPVFVGGMVESAVGRASAAALAAAVGGGVGALPTDLGPSSQYVDPDVAGPVVLDDTGRLVVPDGPGSGVVPDPDVLERVTVDCWSVSV